MCVIDINMVSLLIEDLNREIEFKMDEEGPVDKKKLLSFYSNGDNHCINFLGSCLWSCEDEKRFENIPADESIRMKEREPFEKHLRMLINESVSSIKNITM
jgi:hypothetical protein